MKITRQMAAGKLIDYIHHDISLKELVDWAESAMMEADFEERDYAILRDIISHIGLADVRAFGMSWEDCEDFLARLKYEVNVTVHEIQASA
jgi:hypothetical protein